MHGLFRPPDVPVVSHFITCAPPESSRQPLLYRMLCRILGYASSPPLLARRMYVHGSIALVFFALFLSACNDTGGPPLPENRVSTPEGFEVQGHRGARGLMPENTIPAFQQAIDLGVHTVEMDVVVSADSQLIVSHEPWFHHHISTTPEGDPVAEAEAADYNIFEMTVDEVQAFDVGRRSHPRFPEQQTLEAVKPTLRAAIEAMEDHVAAHGVAPLRYNIETKSRPAWYDTYQPQPDVFAELLRDELQDLGVLDRTIIQSFDPATLVAFRELTDAGATALLVSAASNIEPAMSALGFTPDILSPNYKMVDEDLLADAQAAGMRVIPWTVNEPPAMERLIALGVDGLITDYPDRIVGRPLLAE